MTIEPRRLRAAIAAMLKRKQARKNPNSGGVTAGPMGHKLKPIAEKTRTFSAKSDLAKALGNMAKNKKKAKKEKVVKSPDAVDPVTRCLSEKFSEFIDARERNRQGQFEKAGTGPITPENSTAAYGSTPKKKKKKKKAKKATEIASPIVNPND